LFAAAQTSPRNAKLRVADLIYYLLQVAGGTVQEVQTVVLTALNGGTTPLSGNFTLTHTGHLSTATTPVILVATCVTMGPAVQAALIGLTNIDSVRACVAAGLCVCCVGAVRELPGCCVGACMGSRLRGPTRHSGITSARHISVKSRLSPSDTVSAYLVLLVGAWPQVLVGCAGTLDTALTLTVTYVNNPGTFPVLALDRTNVVGLALAGAGVSVTRTITGTSVKLGGNFVLDFEGQRTGYMPVTSSGALVESQLLDLLTVSVCASRLLGCMCGGVNCVWVGALCVRRACLNSVRAWRT
jgi:hypothetical protein